MSQTEKAWIHFAVVEGSHILREPEFDFLYLIVRIVVFDGLDT